MTPTPTKFLKNCEEMGLFQELSKNPFDDSFKKAMDEPLDHNTNLQIPVTDCDNLDTPQPPIPKVVIGGEVIHEHGKQDKSKDLSSIVPKKRKKFLQKSFSTSEDEDDALADSPSVPLTGSSVESNSDNINNNEPVHVTEYMYISTGASKTPQTMTASNNITTTLTSAIHTSQSVPIAPVTTTAAPVAAAGSNVLIPVIVQLPTGQLVTLQVPASSLTNNQTAAMGHNGMQLTNGAVTQTLPSVLNLAKSSVPTVSGPPTNIAVTQPRIVSNNIPLTIKSAMKPNENVQTTMLVNQPILQNVLNQSGSQPTLQATLNQSNPQTTLQNLFSQTGSQAALQTILNQSRTQTVLKPVINQTVSQPALRVAVSQSGAQSGVVGMPSVLNISGLPAVLNQSNTQANIKPVLLPNKQIGLLATNQPAKVSQSVQSTSSADTGNQSYAKQRLKAALQQQMTPSSGQKSSQLYQMVDVKREPQSSPGLNDSRNITSPGAVSSPESVFSPRGSQMFDIGGNNDLECSDPEGRRMKFLERNRAAAARCRQKRKRWVHDLEQKADDLSSVNNKLLGEIKKLRGEVAHLKTLMLAHKDCPVTMQQRSQGQISSVMFEEDEEDIMEITLNSSNTIVTSAETSPLNNQLSMTVGGSANGNQPNISSLPVGLIQNMGTNDHLPVVMKPIGVLTGPNSLALIPKILNIDQSSILTSTSSS